MFRLGELYFERSSITFQDAYDAAEAAEDVGDESATDSLPASPDFTPTIDVYKRLIRNFPDYARVGRCLLSNRLHAERDGPPGRGARGMARFGLRKQV